MIPDYDPERGTGLAASFFADDSWTGGLMNHPMTHAGRRGEPGYVPSFVVELFLYADQRGCEYAESLRELIDEWKRDEDLGNWYDVLSVRCTNVLGWQGRDAGVAALLDVKSEEFGFEMLFAPQGVSNGFVSRAIERTAMKYPRAPRPSEPGRVVVDQRVRSASAEYTARYAQAMGIYQPEAHGVVSTLTPANLRRRIIRLSIHAVAQRNMRLAVELGYDLATSAWADPDAKWIYARRAQEGIPILFDAFALGHAATREKRETPRGAYVGQWDHLFGALAKPGDYEDLRANDMSLLHTSKGA